MSKVSVQFHALPDEVINFAVECAKIYNLYVVKIQLFPSFAATLVNEADIEKHTTDMERWRIVSLCGRLPDLTANRYIEYLDANKGCLIVDVVRYLLSIGMDPNAVSKDLTHSLVRDSGNEAQPDLEMARLLVSQGFIPDRATLLDHANPDERYPLPPAAEYLWKHVK